MPRFQRTPANIRIDLILPETIHRPVDSHSGARETNLTGPYRNLIPTETSSQLSSTQAKSMHHSVIKNFNCKNLKPNTWFTHSSKECSDVLKNRRTITDDWRKSNSDDQFCCQTYSKNILCAMAGPSKRPGAREKFPSPSRRAWLYSLCATSLPLIVWVYLHSNFRDGLRKRSYFETECEMAVQGHPRSLILVPFESAYVTFY